MLTARRITTALRTATGARWSTETVAPGSFRVTLVQTANDPAMILRHARNELIRLGLDASVSPARNGLYAVVETRFPEPIEDGEVVPAGHAAPLAEQEAPRDVFAKLPTPLDLRDDLDPTPADDDGELTAEQVAEFRADVLAELPARYAPEPGPEVDDPREQPRPLEWGEVARAAELATRSTPSLPPTVDQRPRALRYRSGR